MDPKDLASEVMKQLNIYSKEATEIMEDAADEALKRSIPIIKEHAGFKEITGDYLKSWAVAKGERGNIRGGAVAYAQAPYYRRAHLLENGHIMPQGGRSRDFPHIIFGAEAAVDIYEQLVKERLERNA